MVGAHHDAVSQLDRFDGFPPDHGSLASPSEHGDAMQIDPYPDAWTQETSRQPLLDHTRAGRGCLVTILTRRSDLFGFDA